MGVVGWGHKREPTMRSLIIAIATVSMLGSVATAQAGCVTGAVVGGIAGHMVGHGGVGAAAGCAVGHHHSKKKQEQH